MISHESFTILPTFTIPHKVCILKQVVKALNSEPTKISKCELAEKTNKILGNMFQHGKITKMRKHG